MEGKGEDKTQQKKKKKSTIKSVSNKISLEKTAIYSSLHCFSSLSFCPGKPTTLHKIMGKAEMWLIRTSWDFEFPHPYLPNFEFVGGLHCKPAKPLPKVIKCVSFCLSQYLPPGMICSLLFLVFDIQTESLDTRINGTYPH